MRILVTGGAGFIGKHLCRRLRADGHDVWSLDLSHSVNIDERERCANVKWVNSFADYPRFDRLYHLACHASPAKYQIHPGSTLETCIWGTSAAISCAANSDARILLTSTSEIYGEPLVHPQLESYRGNVTTTGPRSCYDEGKRCAETMMYCAQHAGVDTRIARIFNTYGPGMDFDDGRVISNFVTQALKGEPLTIYGDGSQTRSFCYIEDMVEGLIRLMEYEGAECHEPHNLGNPTEFSILELRDYLMQVAKGGFHPIAYRKLPLPTDDPTRRCPDITRAKRNLGWEPKVSLSDGLRRTVEDFRERMK